MSDSPWQSPSGSDPMGAGGAAAGQPGSGGFGAPPPPPPVAGAAPGWAPPPRPGLIPLAPLGLGTILGASFRVLRRNPLPTVGLSLAIHVVIGILTILVTGYFTAAAFTAYYNDLTAGNSAGAISSILPTEAGAFVVGLIGYVGDAILQGIITVEVARGTLGEKLTLAGLWGKARGRIGALIGWAFLVIGVVLVAIILWVGLAILLIATAGTAGSVIGIILIVLVFPVGITAWVWIGTKISMVPSVLVLERRTLGKAIRRSWSLTSGYFFFWRTFGIEILVSVALAFAAGIIAAPFTLIVSIFTSVANPVGIASGAAGATAAFSVSLIVSTVISAITGTITAIVLTSTTALLYIDLRIRKEGLDLELMRYVDARATGADLPDPYLPKASASA